LDRSLQRCIHGGRKNSRHSRLDRADDLN
jgi:hypothetical protein